MKVFAAIGAITALALGSTPAHAGEPQPQPMSIHLGTFVNVGWGSIEYQGDFAAHISATASAPNGTMYPTSVSINLSSILAESGYDSFSSVTVRDTGLNLYSPASPGADVDWLAFSGLHDDLTVSYAYDGPISIHQNETSEELAVRVAEIDSLSGHTNESDVRHVSLGLEGELTAHVSGWAGGGSGDGSGGGGPIIPQVRGADTDIMLLLSEAGMGESFELSISVTNVPAPGALALFAVAVFAPTRRRRRN